MDLKYREELSKIPNCPPSKKVGERDVEECYRIVFDPIEDPRNFLPPSLLNSVEGEATCSSYALSFFETEKSAVSLFKYLLARWGAVRIGTHIAKGTICKCDGLATTTNNKGHFDLFQSNSSDLKGKFEIERKL